MALGRIAKTKIGITGSSGFIGQNLKLFLDAHNIQYKTFQGDLGDCNKVRDFFRNTKFTTVVHLAGRFDGSFPQLLNTNVLLLKNVLDIGIKSGLRKIIYISSAAVYGNVYSGTVNEKSDLSPNTDYSLSKLYAEKLIEYYHLTKRIDYTIFRFPSVYGHNNNKGVIYSFLHDIKKNKKITIYGDGKQIRNFLHVNDACQAIALSLNDTTSETYNVTSTKPISLNQIVSSIKRKFTFKIKYKTSNNRLVSIRLSDKKIRKKLQYFPRYPKLKL